MKIQIKKVTISKAKTVRSTFDVSAATKLDLGWAGIGQYTTLVNPCQMLMFMGAIANGGTAVNPYIIEESSSLSQIKTTESTAIKLSPDTAEKIGKMLRSNVHLHRSRHIIPVQFIGLFGGV